MGIWRVTVLLISLSYQGKSEKVRCYCNLEECLRGGSVCLSEAGGCFYNFHITSNRGIKQVERGCFSLLKKERQELCKNAPGLPSWSSTSFLLCCQSDMCNQYLGPISNLTHSLIGSLINTTEEQKDLLEGFGRPGTQGQRHPHEIWFKAATIVVPICGAMILFFLIALAFKILRADHANVGKYCKKASKSNANYLDSHVINFKAGELNSEDFSKKMPLLCETRQSENFRNFTAARIHFGQNVNILKEAEDANKVEKNLENEKINLEKPRFRQQQQQQSRESVVATTSRNNLDVANDNNNNNNNHTGGDGSSYSEVSAASAENSANSVLDVRVPSVAPEKLSNLPVMNLNLDKTENLNSFNIYTSSPKTTCRGGQTSCCGKVHEKVYDKRFL